MLPGKSVRVFTSGLRYCGFLMLFALAVPNASWAEAPARAPLDARWQEHMLDQQNLLGPLDRILVNRAGLTHLLVDLVAGGVPERAHPVQGAKGALGLRAVEDQRDLPQLEKYGQGEYRQLENGLIRYYGDSVHAMKPGEMLGRRLVREWNPATGATRTWHEVVDRAGRVRSVRQVTDTLHYLFDEAGRYIGTC